jgi:hypothetical protein
VNLALMCIFIGIKVVAVFLTVHEVLNPKALFDTGELEDINYEESRSNGNPELDPGNVTTAENAEAFALGTRVVHQIRGPGVIYKIDRSDARGKLYVVHYDNMERHQYSKAQAVDKLQVDTRHRMEWPEDVGAAFSPGMRILHFLHGEGLTISFDKSRNAPYLLSYTNGQTKWYPATFLYFPCSRIGAAISFVLAPSCRDRSTASRFYGVNVVSRLIFHSFLVTNGTHASVSF